MLSREGSLRGVTLATSKARFGLLDRRFGASPGAVLGVTPQKLEWERDVAHFNGPVFFSHEKMLQNEVAVSKHLRFGLLVESESIAKTLYRDVESVMGEYSLVFTHSRRLLRKFSNARWIPGGGCWVAGEHGGGEAPEIFDKTKNISMLTSNKKMVPDHVLRYEVAKKIERNFPLIDVYRQVGSSIEDPIQLTTGGVSREVDRPVFPLRYLKDYRYTVVVENNRTRHYFTEKLINCFATGTIPIYRGAKSIGDFFDGAGIIRWSSPAKLMNRVLPSLDEGDYQSRLKAVRRNFELSSNFFSIEDYIVEHYGAEIARLSFTR